MITIETPTLVRQAITAAGTIAKTHSRLGPVARLCGSYQGYQSPTTGALELDPDFEAVLDWIAAMPQEEQQLLLSAAVLPRPWEAWGLDPDPTTWYEPERWESGAIRVRKTKDGQSYVCLSWLYSERDILGAEDYARWLGLLTLATRDLQLVSYRLSMPAFPALPLPQVQAAEQIRANRRRMDATAGRATPVPIMIPQTPELEAITGHALVTFGANLVLAV